MGVMIAILKDMRKIQPNQGLTAAMAIIDSLFEQIRANSKR